MKHIIWDFNGTLLNDAQLSVDLDNDVFDQIGVPRITLEDYRNNMTMPVRDFYPRVGVDYAKHSYEEIARLWLDEFNKRAVGVGLIGLGVVVNVLAAAEHRRVIADIDRGAPYTPPRWSLATLVAVLLAGLGVAMAASMLRM